jgi:hypothetical protein
MDMIRDSAMNIGGSVVSTIASWVIIRRMIIILQVALITNRTVHVTSLFLLSQSTSWSSMTGNTRKVRPEKYKSQSLLDRSGGILYRTSILPSKKEWDIIYEEVMGTLPLLQPESKSSIAQHRLGIALSTATSPTVQLLSDPESSVAKYINRIATAPGTTAAYRYVLAPDIPVEIRSYETKKANMNWHIDDVLYHPVPQIEIILTILNTSNCQTMWQIDQTAIADSEHDTTKIHSIETDPNSLLCLRAGVTSHCVTPLQYGKRIILKCAYIPQGEHVTKFIGTDSVVDSKSTTKTTASTKPQFQSIKKNKQLRRK